MQLLFSPKKREIRRLVNQTAGVPTFQSICRLGDGSWLVYILSELHRARLEEQLPQAPDGNNIFYSIDEGATWDSENDMVDNIGVQTAIDDYQLPPLDLSQLDSILQQDLSPTPSSEFVPGGGTFGGAGAGSNWDSTPATPEYTEAPPSVDYQSPPDDLSSDYSSDSFDSGSSDSGNCDDCGGGD